MNLLPPNEKNNLRKGLKARFLVVLNLLITFSFVLGTIALVPAYFLIKNDLAFATNSESAKIADEETVQALLKIPNEIETKVKFIQTHLEEKRTIETMLLVDSFLSEKIALQSVSFNRKMAEKDKKGVSIGLFGVASDRESLVVFGNALRESNSFSTVDIPVSSLTKDKDLPFTINLLIAN